VKASGEPPTLHPVISFPLKRLVNPGSTAGGFPWTATASARRNAPVNCTTVKC